MAFNGVGQFNRLYSWITDAANGIFVRADRMDADTNDIAAGLSNCITRDGQSPPSANIPMGGFKITGLANGAGPQDAVTFLQVFTSPNFGGNSSFTNITYTVSGTGVTPPAGDNSTNLATTAFAVGLAFATALPAISATVKGKFVTNDGLVGSWGASSASANSLNYSLFGAL